MNDKILFTTNEGKDITFEELLKKIYENSEAKQRSIENTVAHVGPMVRSVQDAVTLLPYLTDLQNASIKNDDALVKMAAIVSRGISKQKNPKFELNDDALGISADERKELMRQAEELRTNGKPSAASDS